MSEEGTLGGGAGVGLWATESCGHVRKSLVASVSGPLTTLTEVPVRVEGVKELS